MLESEKRVLVGGLLAANGEGSLLTSYQVEVGRGKINFLHP